jgi:hypothetical protein
MMTPAQAYDEACRQLGHAMVSIADLEREKTDAEAERDEAGARIVELLNSVSADANGHAAPSVSPLPQESPGREHQAERDQ